MEIQNNRNVFAAPRTRPAGMDANVAYQPMLERRNQAFDWVSTMAIKVFYDSGAASVPPKIWPSAEGVTFATSTPRPSAIRERNRS